MKRGKCLSLINLNLFQISLFPLPVFSSAILFFSPSLTSTNIYELQFCARHCVWEVRYKYCYHLWISYYKQDPLY